MQLEPCQIRLEKLQFGPFDHEEEEEEAELLPGISCDRAGTHVKCHLSAPIAVTNWLPWY